MRNCINILYQNEVKSAYSTIPASQAGAWEAGEAKKWLVLKL
jgi:hypothetical protein